MKASPAGKVLYSTVIPGNASTDPTQVFNSWLLPTGIAVDANG
jgi:hypothetical protein